MNLVFSFLVALFVYLVIWFVNKRTKDYDITLWEYPNPLLELEGKYKPNKILSQGFHVEGDYYGPESMDFDPDNGDAYLGLSDGSIGLFDKNGNFIKTILFVGGYIKDSQNNSEVLNSKIKAQTQFDLFQWCKQEALSRRLAWNPEGDKLCGRPLGIRFRKEKNKSKVLYFADAYHGIFKLDLTTNHIQHLVSSDTKIVLPQISNRQFDPSLLIPPKFFNDLDISRNGKIYFTDSSYKKDRSGNREVIIEGAPHGRLFYFNQKKKILKVVLCGLHFPNGVQILRSEGSESGEASKSNKKSEALLVGELGRFRVLKINPKSSFLNKGLKLNAFDEALNITESHALASCEESGAINQILNNPQHIPSSAMYERYGIQVFVDSIPGIIDNIRLDDRRKTTQTRQSNYLIGLGSVSAKPFSLLWYSYQNIWLRKLIFAFVPMRLAEMLVPKYGLVVFLDSNGQVVSSYHDPSGKVHLVSQASFNPVTNDLWLGSLSEKLVIVKQKYLP